MDNIHITTTRGTHTLNLTFNFDDCTVEHLAPFVAAHLKTRYVQALMPAKEGKIADEVPEALKGVIKVADLRVNLRGDVEAKKVTKAEKLLDELPAEQRKAFLLEQLAKLGIED